jgi:GH25 family lysozyme M1 (1,4-beta-N-acetylmuramidase)
MAEFNDGSQYRIVTDPGAQLRERGLFMGRATSSRGGVPYVDTAFTMHRDLLAGMPALCWYQYANVAAGTAEQNAAYFLQALGGVLRWNEMVMLDVESGGGFTTANVQDFASRWLALVEATLACRSWVYVPSALAPALPRSVTGQRIVMAPRYSGGPLRGAPPWWPWDVHQYTDQGPFPGCSQTGDTSYTVLSAADMLARCNPSGLGASPCQGGTDVRI